MGTFHVDCEIVNIRQPRRSSSVPKMLADAGAEFTLAPQSLLRSMGVKIVKKDLEFLMANGQVVTRSTGYAILRCGDFETVDEIVFGQEGDMALSGARSLEGFGASIDPRGRRLVAAGPHPAA
jgi:predicted aspartyl protease